MAPTSALCGLALAALLCLPAAAQIRIGIIGTDTSHATAFTALLNDPSAPNHIPGARVVAAYKGGSPDIPESANRVEKYAEELRSKHGVEIVPDIPTLLTKVDAILLESVDGRPHLAQFREVAKSGKPVFIDKPLASTLADAREIARLARASGVKWFTSSALRYSAVLAELRLDGLNGVIVWGPGPTEPHHELDLSWYGIHAVETLYTLLGTGCVEVSRTTSEAADVVTGRWSDGRIGTVRLNRPYSAFGAAAFSPKTIRTSSKDLYTGYADLVRSIITFFQTGVPPVAEAETLEIFEFMEAARQSKLKGGIPVPIR